ncbi:MAG TPA: SDR family NAD(P)-dependent oxidoreductase [Burkholderiaceae bacterium]|nr:SDR family NAD(P)-dependent oxidoreductase [Burkholderiaceae bacterium]
MKTRRLYIVTGASRGLGAALAEQLLADDVLLLTLSRRPDAALATRAAAGGARLEQWAIDIGHDIGAAARLEAWLHGHSATGLRSAALINNAGVVGHVGSITLSRADELAAVLRINLEAPLLLTAAFLRATRGWTLDKRVLNISSGAAQRPITGWTAYCASKAGLDMFTRTAAQDEALLPNPARLVALAPGVIDTDMQAQLRAADGSGFPDQPRFVEYHSTGQLVTPAWAAERVLAFLADAAFGSEPVARLHT